MTTREQKICRKILDALHDLDGGQHAELMLHADVALRLGGACSLAEFNAALAICDTRKWVTGITGKNDKPKYNISDRGEAARLEL
jgi:hypothetical protein